MEINYKNITLKPVSECDLEPLRNWRNDKKLCKYLRDVGTISKENQYIWYINQKNEKNSITFSIYETKDLKRLVGCISLYNIKTKHAAEIGRILVGDPNAHGRGIGKNAMKALIDYGFGTYGLKQITLIVHQENVAAYTIYKSLGFKKINKRKSHIYGYEDIMVLSKEKS